MAAELSSTGQFRGADSSHPASGGVEIVKLKGGGLGVKLKGDFKVRGGPDLRVWLSDASNPRNGRAVRSKDYVDLGRLKSSSGEQIYRIPASADVADANSVVIWCRAFGVFFGSATLK
ncbi:DM13 domain-containing protein [Erythrobacter litoralis]|uniref:Putative secreted protein n=1 Tax=Erythrobacter litoralis (strain HTCC2594) TaxID=314225 RepID=Q2N9U5_ERYLH|nr:DM13 domain-containing protein [Erythrobacter litoralis]ABC63546.1 putative secreted protein [Erythrobacter litoralis HTCC2594]